MIRTQPAVTLLGRVYPRGLIINASAPDVTYRSDDGTIEGDINLIINRSAIRVSWYTDNYSRDNLWPFWSHADRIATSVVNLIAFRGGWAATTVIDRYEEAGGFSDKIAFVEPAVQGISSLLQSDENLLAAFTILTKRPHLMVVMEDLIATLWSQEHKALNCARCVEAIRSLVADESSNASDQWLALRNALNLDRRYIELIMHGARNSRHGRPSDFSAEDVTEIMRRTWTIIYRYLELQMRECGKLDSTTFPLLHGDDPARA